MTEDRKPHKVMTPKEYDATLITGWHEVCRDVDGFGGVGIRYTSATIPANTQALRCTCAAEVNPDIPHARFCPLSATKSGGAA
jgi:hypothetical protein